MTSCRHSLLGGILAGLVVLSNWTAAAVPTYEEKAVAAVLIGEAGGEGKTGMTAVAEVILCRAREKQWTIREVIGFPLAFSCLNETTVEALIRKNSSHKRYSEALQIARRMLRSPASFQNITRGANHFEIKTRTPGWAKGRKPVAVIGRHAFYRL